MFAEYPDVVDVQTLKNMLNVGQVLAYKLVKSGEIKSRKVGREYKIPKVNVIAYLLGENGVKL
ncbi:MAG: helix-turn-helix domain-containing protein [Clostridia bacterium]|nr:helix-turn-helix domain-containing protein [Clostridia bacterium]MBR5388596.1 helix-turn-helix domain-containing protein [Clostridia bacterium]